MDDIKDSVQRQFAPVAANYATSAVHVSGPDLSAMLVAAGLRGGERVLDALDLRLVPGVTALLGRNGAGKTTLVRILATLLAPDSGRARVCGYDVITNAAAVRRRIGVTGQFAAVDGVLTGRENLELVGRLWGLGHRARARADELSASPSTRPPTVAPPTTAAVCAGASISR